MSLLSQPEDPKPSAPEWLVTYADFMTLLLAFFVMIVSVSDINLHDGRFDSLKTSFGQHFGGENATASESDTVAAPRNAPLAKWIARSFDERRRWLSGDTAGEAPPGSGAALQAALRFENRSVALSSEHVAELSRRAATWKTSGGRFEIVGYIEPREGTEADDFSGRVQRAQERCAQLQQWLVDQGGVLPENIRLTVIPTSQRSEPPAAGASSQLDLYSSAAPATTAAAVGTGRINDLRFTNGGYANPVR